MPNMEFYGILLEAKAVDMPINLANCLTIFLMNVGVDAQDLFVLLGLEWVQLKPRFRGVPTLPG